jgi:hypothetical protein
MKFDQYSAKGGNDTSLQRCSYDFFIPPPLYFLEKKNSNSSFSKLDICHYQSYVVDSRSDAEEIVPQNIFEENQVTQLDLSAKRI